MPSQKKGDSNMAQTKQALPTMPMVFDFEPLPLSPNLLQAQQPPKQTVMDPMSLPMLSNDLLALPPLPDLPPVPPVPDMHMACLANTEQLKAYRECLEAIQSIMELQARLTGAHVAVQSVPVQGGQQSEAVQTPQREATTNKAKRAPSRKRPAKATGDEILEQSTPGGTAEPAKKKGKTDVNA